MTPERLAHYRERAMAAPFSTISRPEMLDILDHIRDLEAQIDELARDFAEFRRDIRSKLWPFWPSNVGVSDDEVIDAVGRCVGERGDLEAQLAAAREKAQVAGRAMDSMVTDHVARLHRIGNLVAEGLNEPLTTATPPSPEVGE